MTKVLLTLFDGLRPDAMQACPHPAVGELLAHSAYSLKAKTVYPSATLPCHLSLMQSVDPTRHGVLTNTFTPQPNPVKGLFELLDEAHKTCGFFYNWEQLRDISSPAHLTYSEYFSQDHLGPVLSNTLVGEAARRAITSSFPPDFVFLYLGWPDEAGHSRGWMSPYYHEAVHHCFAILAETLAILPEDALVVLTADHGGHDRLHGTRLPEDMTVPLFFYQKNATPKALADVSILDIAPTIANAFGLAPDPDWDGRVLPLD